MKRLALKLVLFLLLGAIVNVAVAWGCAIGIRPNPIYSRRNMHMDGQSGWVWITSKSSGTGMTHVASRSNYADMISFFGGSDPEGDIPLWAASTHPPFEEMRYSIGDFVIDGRGWPMLSLWSACGASNLGSYNLSAITRGITVEQYMRLPIRPIWPGFAINTIFYAGVLWLLFAAPGMVRRRVRHVRGRCIHCGYDLRGHLPGAGADSSKCPECGRNPPLPRGEGSGVRVQPK